MHVVLGADDVAAMPLTAAARSVLDARSEPVATVVHVLDSGIGAQSRQRIERSLDAEAVEVRWHSPSVRMMPELSAASGSTYPPAAFARLQPPSLLVDVDRVVYLDVDLVVRRDLSGLAELPFGDAACLAAVDADGDGVLGTVSRFDAAATGADPTRPYVNTGVMVIDLDAWRTLGVTERSLELVRRHPGQFGLADQDVLNVVLAGRMGALDRRWNVYSALLHSPCGLDDAEHRAVLADPWIVHFTQRPKPWHRGCHHPRRDEFLRALDRTAWSGWRPSARNDLADRGRRLARRLRPTG